MLIVCFFFFKQKTAYEMRISDWSSDVCSSDLETVSTATLCAGALRSNFDLALERLDANGVDTDGLGLAIGFEFGPTAITRLGMRGGKAHCSVSLLSAGPGRQAGAERLRRKLQWIPRQPERRRVQLAGCASSRSEEHTSELQSLMRISY